jgi:hypothetical protein
VPPSEVVELCVVVGGCATVRVTVLGGVVTVSVTAGSVVVMVTGTVSVAAGSVDIAELRLAARPEGTEHAAKTTTSSAAATRPARVPRTRRPLRRSLPCSITFPPSVDHAYTNDTP